MGKKVRTIFTFILTLMIISSSTVISNASVGNDEIKVKGVIQQYFQTEYKKPLTPKDENFDMYKSGFLGKFDIVTKDENGKEVDRLNLNEYFKDTEIGFIGQFELETSDYNVDGNLDFAVGEPAENGLFKYVLFSIDNSGKLYCLPVEGDYIYNAGSNHSQAFILNKNGNGINVTITSDNGYKDEEYIWVNGNFILNK